MCRTNMNKILQPYWGYIKGELSKYSYKEKLKALKLSIQPSKKSTKKGTRLWKIFDKTILSLSGRLNIPE